MLTWPPKYPEEILDYAVDWSSRLGPEDKIMSADVQVEEGTIVLDRIAHDDTKVTFWATGGTLGNESRVRVQIQTEDGRRMRDVIKLPCHPAVRS